MPYLIKFFDTSRGGNMEDEINKFLIENYQKDKEFEPISIQHLLGVHSRLLYKCGITNKNYVKMVK